MKNKKTNFGKVKFLCLPQRGFQKRAQGFSFMLVLITLFMCGSSIYVFIVQQGNAESSLVSPLVVLEVRDSLTIFEMREKELIEKSLAGVNVDFADDEFSEQFKDIFIEGFILDEKMKEFVLGDLMWNGAVMDSSTFDENSFFKNVLYSKSERSSDGLKFVRSKIGKSVSLDANSETKTNFPVDFKFEFEREYLISFENDKFKVEAV